jgi:hypothetical protein
VRRTSYGVDIRTERSRGRKFRGADHWRSDIHIRDGGSCCNLNFVALSIQASRTFQHHSE